MLSGISLKEALDILNTTFNMDKKSKILLLVFCLLVIVSIALTYYRSFISKDFEIIQDDSDGEAVMEIAN